MVDSVYNHLALAQLAKRMPKSLSRKTTHERKELRQIYNNIINLNKRSPIYIIKLSEENQNHALGIKEASMELNGALSSICDYESGTQLFSHKISYSENESCATAEIIVDDYSRLPSPFELQVDSLACSQINKSIPLYPNGVGPYEGSYQFTIEVDDNSYEFQFHIASNTRNQEIQTKLADFINQTNIGIHAEVELNSNNDRITLSLESDSTGITNGLTFKLLDSQAPDYRMGIVEFYDLNNVVTYPKNAKFQINGAPKESLSNSFTLNQSLEISLLSKSDEPFYIKYQPDVDRILTSISQVVGSYNHLMQLANDYPSRQHLSTKLIHDVTNALAPYNSLMESCGLLRDDNGFINIDPSLAIQSIKEGDMDSLFTSSGFVPSLIEKLNSITINPMEYVDKTIVSYPDTSKPGVGKSYITSIYSGMLFNYYC
jgi:flagellar hook-associated protein 2